MISVVLTLLVAQTPGFTKPEPGTLRRVLGLRFTKDLSEFDLLEINEEEWTTPLISDDNVRGFVGTRKGKLYAYDLTSGEELWKRSDMGAIGASMIEFRQKVILGSDSSLVALDQQIGKERWRLDLDAPIGGRMVRTGTIAVIPIRPNAYVAVDLLKGERIWQTKRPTPEGISVRGQAPPAIDRVRRRAYLGFSDGALVSMNLDTGGTEWVAQLGNARDFFADVDSQPQLVDGGRAVIAAAYNAGLFKVEAETGRVIWKREQTRINSLTRVGASMLVAGHGDGQVLGIGTSKGNVRWRFRFVKGAPVEPLSIGRNLVAVGCTAGPMAVLSIDDGRPVQLVNPGSGVSVPAFWDDPDLLLLSNKALLLVMRYGSGTGTAPMSLNE